MGWRDVSVLVLVDLPTRGQHIAEIQLQLEDLAAVRETEHAAYEEIRSFFSTDEMIKKQDEIMQTIQTVLESVRQSFRCCVSSQFPTRSLSVTTKLRSSRTPRWAIRSASRRARSRFTSGPPVW